jgi:hypothetical protein
MATYKVPQDVESEDKLIGPLSLKQFIFAILFFASGYITYLFSQIPPKPLFGIVGLPFLLIFGILAFYQRKDQPVEVYLLAWLNYHLKPKVRVWDQEGYEEHVIITVPKVEEIDYTKGLNRRMIEEKTKQFSQIVDTRGWSAKGVTVTSTGLAGDQRILTNDDLLNLRNGAAMVSGSIVASDPPAEDQQEDSPIAENVDNLMADHQINQQNNIKLTVEQARQEVIASEGANLPGSISTTPQPPVYSNINPEITNLANNDLLPVSEIAKKAQALQDEVEIKLN